MVSLTPISLLTISEFNYYRDESGKCTLVEGAYALSSNTEYEQCDGSSPYWYERTEYRKIPYSSCEGGDRPDRGKRHDCPGLIGGAGVSGLVWGSIAILPFALAALGGWWWYNKAGQAGSIRLGDHRAFAGGGGSSALDVLASVPYFLLGVAQEVWSWVERKVPFVDGLFSRRTPYRSLPIDDDGESTGHNIADVQPRCWEDTRTIRMIVMHNMSRLTPTRR